MELHENNRFRWILSFFIIILFWILLGSSFINIYSSISFLFDKNKNFINTELYNYIGSNIPFLCMWLGFYFCFKYINNIKLSKLSNSSNNFKFKMFYKILLFSIFYFIIIIIIGKLINLYNFEYIKNKAIERAIFIPFALFLTPLQVIAEEILFRAIILKIIIKDYDFLRNKKNSLFLSTILSIFLGLLFIVPHLLNPELNTYFLGAILYYFIFGSLATFSILITNGLEIAIAIHLANNFIITFFCTYKDSALTAVPLFIKTNENPISPYYEAFSLLFLFMIIALKNKKIIKEYLFRKNKF